MARVNERTFEFTPVETQLKNRAISPGQEVRSAPFDVRGAKIFCAWVKSEGGDCEAYFEYLCEEGKEVLQKTSPKTVAVSDGLYTRFQFGTYGDAEKGRAELPALYLVLVVKNSLSENPVTVTARGMSQLQ